MAPGARQKLAQVFGADAADAMQARFAADAAIVNNATRINPNVGSVTSQAQMGEGGFLPMAAEAIRAVRSPIEATLAAMSKGGSYSQAQRDIMGQMLLDGATPENLARIFGNRGGRRGGSPPSANAPRTEGNPPPSGPAAPPPEQAGFIRSGILGPAAGAGAGATLNPIDANGDGVIDDADRWGNAAGGALSAAILGKTASTIGNRLARGPARQAPNTLVAPKAPAGAPKASAANPSDQFGDKAWAAQKKMGAGRAPAVERVDTSTWTTSDFQAARNQLRDLMSERKTAPPDQWLDYDTEIAQLKQALNQDAPKPPPVKSGFGGKSLPMDEASSVGRARDAESISFENGGATLGPAEAAFFVDGNDVAIHTMRVRNAAERGNGAASRLLDAIIHKADAEGMRILLTADPFGLTGGMTKPQLEKWYKSRGFKPNKGKSQDFSVSATFIRDPSQSGRRREPSWETQDVPDDQQIVRFGGGKAESRPNPPPTGNRLPPSPKSGNGTPRPTR
jgi:hypothetical protein